MPVVMPGLRHCGSQGDWDCLMGLMGSRLSAARVGSKVDRALAAHTLAIESLSLLDHVSSAKGFSQLCSSKFDG
jgi:hypothetical protein